jgi:hypothetical protein
MPGSQNLRLGKNRKVIVIQLAAGHTETIYSHN